MEIVLKCQHFQWDIPHVTVPLGRDSLLTTESSTACCCYQEAPLGHPARSQDAQRGTGPTCRSGARGAHRGWAVYGQSRNSHWFWPPQWPGCAARMPFLPGQLPAPSLGSCHLHSQLLQLCLLWEFCKHRASLQPWLLPPPSPLPLQAGFPLESCFSLSWNSPGWSRAGRRQAGTWPQAVAGLGSRCWDAQECPSRSFALSFLSLSLVKILQSPSDGSQMCCRCLCFTEHCSASCTP